jgi:hypothetical protein
MRWATFGSNVAVAILLATALVVAAVWLSVVLLKGKVRSDWTASGRYSLSDRSRAVLKGLTTDVELGFVYSDPRQAAYDYATPQDFRRELLEYERAGDLMDNYERASKRIVVKRVDPLNPVQADGYLEDLRKAFSEGFERKQELLKEFTAFRDDLDAFVEKEIAAITGFEKVQPRPPAALRQSLTSAANELLNLSKKLQRKFLGEMLGAQLAGPSEEASLDEAKTLTNTVSESFKEYPAFYQRVLEAGEKGQFGAPLVPEVKTFLEGAAARYDPLRERAEKLKEKVAGRTEAKFDEIEQRFRNRVKFIVVRGPKDVAVLGPEDLWLQRPGEEGAQEGVFGGERTLTAAILGQTSPEKTAVLFVTFGAPATGWGGPYSRLAERLRGLNFVVEDWDLMRDPEMPKPEGASRTVLVLVPPAPPNPQRPMPPPQPESFGAAVEAVKAGTGAVVLAEQGGMFAPPLPYKDLFDALGVEAKLEAVAVHKIVVDQEGTERAIPELYLTDYQKAPITSPLGALPTYMITAVPLVPKADLPADQTIQTLLVLPSGSDYWAETNTFSVQSGAEFSPTDDLVSTKAKPLALALAVTRKVKEKDKEVEQRVALFGDSDFAEDRVAFYRDRGGRDLFPGNAELLANSLLWVAGKDDLITVSPEALAARRIREVPFLALFQIGVMLVLPILAGVVGIVVLAIRRR